LRLALLDWHLHHLLAAKRTPALRRLKVTDLALKFEKAPQTGKDQHGAYLTKKRAWLALAGIKR